MVTRRQGLPGVAEYSGRLRRACATLLSSRNQDGGIGRTLDAVSNVQDTARLLSVAKCASESWEHVSPSVDYLIQETKETLGYAASLNVEMSTEAISSLLNGLTVYSQAATSDDIGLSLTLLVRAAKRNWLDGAWAESTHRSDRSLAQTARMVSALRQVAHFCRVAGEYGIHPLGDEELVKLLEMIVEGVRFLLAHREHGSGWRMSIDSQTPISAYTTAECVLALEAARDLMAPLEKARGTAMHIVGEANVAPPMSMTLESVVGESALWLMRANHKWAGSNESDVRGFGEPWSRLTYAVAPEAALLAGEHSSALDLSFGHLNDQWLEEYSLWGEFDENGKISLPTVRGTYHAVRSNEALRGAILREATSGLVEFPHNYEPMLDTISDGKASMTLAQGEARGAVEFTFRGRSFSFTRPAEEIRVLQAILESGVFGATYSQISLASNVPRENLATYIQRINRTASATTHFAMGDILLRMPGKSAQWRLNPMLDWRDRGTQEAGEVG